MQRTRAIGSVLNTLAAWVIGALALILILSILGVNAASLVAMAGFLGAAAGVGATYATKWARELPDYRTLDTFTFGAETPEDHLHRAVAALRNSAPA